MPCPKTPFPREALPAKFGEFVMAAREKRKWSRSRLAAKAGVNRKTIARLESKKTTASLQLVRALMRDEVLGPDLPSIKGWELDEPDRWQRGPRARAARLASDQTLAEVVSKAGGSIASLSSFERGLLAPFAFVGRRFEDDDGGGVSEPYAKALGFDDAADMAAYLKADDPLTWLGRIARKYRSPLPAAALLPVPRIPVFDDTAELPPFPLDRFW